MTHETRRPSPEELLRRVEAEEGHGRRGRLKIFLGYASGVGKSVRMFDEGRRRKRRGQDVVAGAVQPGTEEETRRLLEGLEWIPLRRDLSAPCLDVAAILARRPGVCLIDGLAYRNPPGAVNAERWQDVEELRQAGISVITTINLQYVRERQAEVERIRGKRAEEQVPEAFLRTADDIEVVDAPPEYCLQRATASAAGGVDAVTLARQLSELREIALLLAAEVVEAQLDEYLKRHGLEQSYGTHERVLVCVTPRSNAELMIARGRRQADRFHGELYVMHVEQDALADEDRAALDRYLRLARQAGAVVLSPRGRDFVRVAIACCGELGITQVFVGHSQRRGFWQRFRRNPVERLIDESRGIDIRVFPHTVSRDGR